MPDQLKDVLVKTKYTYKCNEAPMPTSIPIQIQYEWNRIETRRSEDGEQKTMCVVNIFARFGNSSVLHHISEVEVEIEEETDDTYECVNQLIEQINNTNNNNNKE